MKRMVIIVALFLGLATPSFAYFDFPFTGNQSVRYDTIGWSPQPYKGTFLNGSGASNVLEIADEFYISEAIDIDILKFNALVADHNLGEDTSFFYFDIYEGTVIKEPPFLVGPIPDQRIFQSQTPLLVNETPFDKQFSDIFVPFDITLAPGTYWLSKQRGAGTATYSVNQQYGVVPEPSTLGLLAIGLVGLVRRKRS